MPCDARTKTLHQSARMPDLRCLHDDAAPERDVTRRSGIRRARTAKMTSDVTLPLRRRGAWDAPDGRTRVLGRARRRGVPARSVPARSLRMLCDATLPMRRRAPGTRLGTRSDAPAALLRARVRGREKRTQVSIRRSLTMDSTNSARPTRTSVGRPTRRGLVGAPAARAHRASRMREHAFAGRPWGPRRRAGPRGRSARRQCAGAACHGAASRASVTLDGALMSLSSSGAAETLGARREPEGRTEVAGRRRPRVRPRARRLGRPGGSRIEGGQNRVNLGARPGTRKTKTASSMATTPGEKAVSRRLVVSHPDGGAQDAEHFDGDLV